MRLIKNYIFIKYEDFIDSEYTVKYCNTCGRKFDLMYKYCYECGTKLIEKKEITEFGYQRSDNFENKIKELISEKLNEYVFNNVITSTGIVIYEKQKENEPFIYDISSITQEPIDFNMNKIIVFLDKNNVPYEKGYGII